MRRTTRGWAAAWGAMAMCAAQGAVEIRYGFGDATNLGADDSGQRAMICVNATQTNSPAGKGVAFAGAGRLELAAEKCPDFRQGFGVEFWLRAEASDQTMTVAGRAGQFLLRIEPMKAVANVANAAGHLTFFVHGHGWEPRLTAPIPAWGQWFRVRAGWNGRRMLLRVDGHEAVQGRGIRMAASDAPLIVGGPFVGAPLKGAVADLRFHAPAPLAWFEAFEVPEQRALLTHSTPEALARSIRHILKQKPRAYPNGREHLKQAERFAKEMPALLEAVEAAARGDEAARQMLQAFETLKRQALLIDNPFVDFDETLVMLSDRVALRPNWGGTHILPPKGHNTAIARFNLRTGQITEIYKPADGAYVGEMDLHFDGQRLLFTSTDTNNMFQVMEIGVDGGNLRQLPAIAGQFVHNYGGIYLPSENIIFSSTAPLIGVPCVGGAWLAPNLFLMGPNGESPRQLTFEQDANWHPTVLPDGRVMYLRWEYTDIMHYYSRIMMTMNPDGANQRAIYGSQSLWPNAMFNARPLPNSPGQFVAVVSGHHGVMEAGKLTIFDANKGFAHADGVVQHIPGYGRTVTHVTVDQLYPTVDRALLVQFPDLENVVNKLIAEHMPPESQKGKDFHQLENDFYNKCYPLLRHVYPEMALDLDYLVDGIYPQFLQPFPISDHYFLVMGRLTGNSPWRLYLVDAFDNILDAQPATMEGGYEFMLWPYPLRARPRPPVIPDTVNLQSRQAVTFIQNIYRGPGLQGVPPGTVAALRVFTYSYAYFQMGFNHHIGVESSWDAKRVLGTVPVENDGSAMFYIPANTTISLQPLDQEGRAIQLFRSWMVAMPGERLSCIGCHESPHEPPVTTRTLASSRPPRQITPHRPKVEGFSFEIEIQPILNAYCVRCHDGSHGQLPNFKDTRRPAPRSLEEPFSHPWHRLFRRLGPESQGATLPHKRIEELFSNAYHAFHRFFRRPGPESQALMLMPYEFHASTSEGIQLLEKGHHGVKLDDESWRRLYAWIDLNVPFHGSWTSVSSTCPAGKTWATNIAAQAAAMRARYALVENDWEHVPDTPHPVQVTHERGEELKPPVEVSLPGWPFDAETARQMQRQAGGAEPRVVDLGDGLSIRLVRIPAGEFVMGSDNESPQEQPRHRVRVEKPFWMSETEINNALFFAFKPDHNAGFFDMQWRDHVRHSYTANHPVQPAVRMRWLDAQAFCDWLSQRTGLRVALPTEAQWEWACRAGTETPMFFGAVTADFSPYANLADRSLRRHAVVGINPVFDPTLVGDPVFDFIPQIDSVNDNQFLVTGTRQYQPNAWGLHDMHGNVAEWTRSDYVRYPYAAGKSNTGSPTVRKVARGGSFQDRPHRATSSFRLGYLPWQGVWNVGFRIVIED